LYFIQKKPGLMRGKTRSGRDLKTLRFRKGEGWGTVGEKKIAALGEKEGGMALLRDLGWSLVYERQRRGCAAHFKKKKERLGKYKGSAGEKCSSKRIPEKKGTGRDHGQRGRTRSKGTPRLRKKERRNMLPRRRSREKKKRTKFRKQGMPPINPKGFLLSDRKKLLGTQDKEGAAC